MTYLLTLLVFVPVAVVLELTHASPVLVFGASALAIVPLSMMLGKATEELAGYTGPTIGGLLNATLGNLAELIIGAMALRAGLIGLVKASITGSVLGNLLLVLGASFLAGGLRYRSQSFNPQLAGMSIGMMATAMVGVMVPAIFHATHPTPAELAAAQLSRDINLSEYVSVLLMAGYGLSLLYTMGTHRAVFGEGGDIAHGEAKPEWSLTKAIAVLAASAAAIAVMSEFLVGATEVATRRLGLSQLFVGLVVVPIIGNAAEHSSAVMMALKNRIDLSVSISIGSSTQVSLLVAPVLVLLGRVFGQPMDLVFGTMEVAAVTLAVWLATVLVADAESNWLEGALLLIVYGVLAVAFYFF